MPLSCSACGWTTSCAMTNTAKGGQAKHWQWRLRGQWCHTTRPPPWRRCTGSRPCCRRVWSYNGAGRRGLLGWRAPIGLTLSSSEPLPLRRSGGSQQTSRGPGWTAGRSPSKSCLPHATTYPVRRGDQIKPRNWRRSPLPSGGAPHPPVLSLSIPTALSWVLA